MSPHICLLINYYSFMYSSMESLKLSLSEISHVGYEITQYLFLNLKETKHEPESISEF